MSFGTGATGILSRQTSNTVQVADKLDEDGNILESTSFGGITEVTEETHTDTYCSSVKDCRCRTSHGYSIPSHRFPLPIIPNLPAR